MKSSVGMNKVYIRSPERENAMLFVIALAAMMENLLDILLKRSHELPFKSTYDMEAKLVHTLIWRTERGLEMEGRPGCGELMAGLLRTLHLERLIERMKGIFAGFVQDRLEPEHAAVHVMGFVQIVGGVWDDVEHGIIRTWCDHSDVSDELVRDRFVIVHELDHPVKGAGEPCVQTGQTALPSEIQVRAEIPEVLLAAALRWRRGRTSRKRPDRSRTRRRRR